MNKKPAFVFDLDGTINHAASLPEGLLIRGRTTNSFLDFRVIELLLELAKVTDLYVATGRSLGSIEDFRNYFNAFDVEISGWILEHGVIVCNHPGWNKKVLTGIDLDAVHAQAQELVHRKKHAIDTEYYQGSHESILLYLAKDQHEAAAFLSELSVVLDKRFRTIVQSRKIIIIPRMGDKYAAFHATFGKTHCIRCAAGDTPDDLTLLQHAVFPLTTKESSPVVKHYVERFGGFIGDQDSHDGTVAMLKEVLDHFRNDT